MSINLTDYSNKSIGSGLTIQNYTSDTSTVLDLFGQGVNNYAPSLLENFIYLLSNFSSPFPPGSNFTDNYQSNNNWVPTTSSSLKNSKVLMSGQIWFQSPRLPVMSNEVYNIVNQLVNGSGLTTVEVAALESNLTDIYQNSTTYQNQGCLWILNSPVATTVTPLTYNLTGVGSIQVFDITQLGWEQIYPNTLNNISDLNLTNATSNLNFYTSDNASTLTASISGTGGTNNKLYSGNLTFTSGNVYNNITTNYNINAGTGINLTAPSISVNSQNFTSTYVLPTTDNSQKFATTAFVKAVLDDVITSDGGDITGVLTVPDPTNDESKQVANAEYVNAQIAKISQSGKTKLISILDFLGSDNDISTAIPKIISAGYNYIYIPDGVYTANSTISITSDNLTLFGNGNDSIINQTFSGPLFTIDASNVTAKNIYFKASVFGTSGGVINSTNSDNLKIDGIFVDNTGFGLYNGIYINGGTNVKITNCNICGTMADGININNVTTIDITNNTIYDCGQSALNSFNGLTIDARSSNITIRDNSSGNSSTSNKYQQYGISVLSINVVLISSNILYQNVSGLNFLKGNSVANIGNIVN